MSNKFQQQVRLSIRTKGRDLMRQGVILTGLGVAIWAIGTLFFLLFGGWVVLEVNDAYFGSSLFLLVMLTFLLLIGISLIVRLKLFREKGSATRFGYTATIIGLLLSTLTIWYRDSVFTGFTEGQHHGFTIWLTLTGALTLLVPAVVDRFVKDPTPIVEVSVIEATPVVKELSEQEGSRVGESVDQYADKHEDMNVDKLQKTSASASEESDGLDGAERLNGIDPAKPKLD